MRIVFPAYNIDSYNWDRIAEVLKPLSAKHSLQVIVFKADQPQPECSWCKFVQAPMWHDITDLYHISVQALEIVKLLDDFDLFYSWSSGAYFQLINCMISWIAKKPHVIHINGDASLSRSFHYLPSGRIKEDAVDFLTLNSADAIIPISSIIHDSIYPKIKNKHCIRDPVPFSIDATKWRPKPFSPELIIGYSGRVSVEKGFPFFNAVMTATPEQKYRVAGPMQMSLTFPENCNYRGTYLLEEMNQFYGSCSVVALPSYGEGMPASILEAYAAGRPVICTPESIPDELKLFGYLAPHSVVEWKKLVDSLDLDELKRLGAEAREYVLGDFAGWGTFAENMNQIFEEVTK